MLNTNRSSSEVSKATPKVELDLKNAKFTSKQELILEVLIARLRLGENVWTFSSKIGKQLKELELAGWVGYKNGIVEDTFLVWPANEAARKELLAYPYNPPLLEDYISKKSVAERYMLREDYEVQMLKDIDKD